MLPLHSAVYWITHAIFAEGLDSATFSGIGEARYAPWWRGLARARVPTARREGGEVGRGAERNTGDGCRRHRGGGGGPVPHPERIRASLEALGEPRSGGEGEVEGEGEGGAAS